MPTALVCWLLVPVTGSRLCRYPSSVGNKMVITIVRIAAGLRIYLRILIIFYSATFLGTNSLYVLMCRKAVNQSNCALMLQ